MRESREVLNHNSDIDVGVNALEVRVKSIKINGRLDPNRVEGLIRYTMKLISNIISPDISRKPEFVHGENNPPFIWACRQCASENELTFEQLSGMYLKSEQSFSIAEYRHFKEFYVIENVHKSMGGGWPYFYQIQCPGCSKAYLLFLGIKEPEISCLIITIQAITEISE